MCAGAGAGFGGIAAPVNCGFAGHRNTDGIMQLDNTAACMTIGADGEGSPWLDNQPGFSGTTQEQGICYSPLETILKFWAVRHCSSAVLRLRVPALALAFE